MSHYVKRDLAQFSTDANNSGKFLGSDPPKQEADFVDY